MKMEIRKMTGIGIGTGIGLGIGLGTGTAQFCRTHLLRDAQSLGRLRVPAVQLALDAAPDVDGVCVAHLDHLARARVAHDCGGAPGGLRGHWQQKKDKPSIARKRIERRCATSMAPKYRCL